MNRIAYIEIDTHAEIALNFMELMNDSKEFSVDYYFSSKILKTLGLHETKNIRKVTPETINHQLSFINYDLIIIGTVHRYFNVFEKITSKYHSAIICHNLNFVQVNNWDLLKSVFKEDIVFRLKLLLKEGLLLKSKVYQNAKNWLVLDENLLPFIIKNKSNQNVKTTTFLPIFYSKFSEKLQNEIYTIVIPGAVSQKRRDYISVIENIKKVQNFQENNTKKQVIFLGKAEGKELQILQNFESSIPEKTKNLTIKYFTKKVPQPIFDEYMQQADVLWCPIQTKTDFFSIPEYYGITKMSGNLGDAIRFSKIAIFPKKYPCNYPFIFIENENFLSNFKLSNNYNFSKFNIAEVRDKLNNSLLNCIIKQA